MRLIALFLLLALAGCTTGAPGPVTPMAVDAGRAAGLISAYRAANGLGPVGVDSRLMETARDYARTMGTRDKISHSLGGGLPGRLGKAGYDWGAAAENLGAGYASLDAAIEGWKRSAGHRKNLLNPYATEIGIAAVSTSSGAKYRTYWALVLAAPRQEPGPSAGLVAVPAQ